MPDFPTLISSYNLKLRIYSVFNLIGGALSYSLAYLFFRYIPQFVCSGFDLNVQHHWFIIGSLACLALITFTAIKARRENRDATTYHDSIDGTMLQALNNTPTTGSVVIDHYASKVTAPAFALSLLFLAGPNCFLKIQDHLTSIIPNTDQTQKEIHELYQRIKAVGKWHSAYDYLPSLILLIHLSRMDLIALDLIKGRIKAS